jgi:hypothetical protein
MANLLVLLFTYSLIIIPLVLISRDAEKHNIYLSRLTKILFLLTITAQFVLIWYLIKRRKSKENSLIS